MSVSPIGDSLALATLAFNLYSKGYLVVRDAPAEFRLLVGRLQVFRRMILHVNHKVDQDGRSMSECTHAVLEMCSRTLYDFETLLAKYERLAITDRNHWLRRCKWAADRGLINDCHEKVKNDQILLMLALFSEKGLQEWMNKSSFLGDPGTLYSGQNTLAVMPSKATVSSSRKNSFSRTTTEPADSISPQPSRSTIHSRSAEEIPSTEETLLEITPMMNSKSYTKRSSLQRKMAATDVKEIIRKRGTQKTNKLETLHLGQGKPRDPPNPLISQALEQSLEYASDKIKESAVDIETWLRLAIWWLLKYRKIWYVCTQTQSFQEGENSDVPSQLLDPWTTKISLEQACTDLQKSSWILHNKAFEMAKQDLLDNRVMKLVKDLSTALDSEFSANQHPSFAAWITDSQVILNQNLCMLENFHQPIEGNCVPIGDTTNFPLAIQNVLKDPSMINEVLNSPAKLDETSLAMEDVLSSPTIDDVHEAQRWFTVDLESGGLNHEKPLFRTFVNAQVGNKDERVKSQDAPYMLILWTRQGECEIFISLCNQRGTLNLSRMFSSQDLENFEQKGKGSLEMFIEFPSQQAEIRFLSVEDCQMFCAQPRKYFQAMTCRDPQPGEQAIFQTVLESFEDGKDPESTVISSCGLRVYESMPDQRCKTTRRLVVSSPAADTSTIPWCVSYWIPLSKVRLQLDDSLVTMSWSDLRQCEKISRGDFDYYWSYVYKPEMPNREIFMRFSSGEEAERFEECIFFLSETQDHVEMRSKPQNNVTSQELRIYDLQDAIDRSLYHAIALVTKTSLMHVSELYYAYRNLDFVLQSNLIQFPELRSPHYVTNMQRMPDPPTKESQIPELLDVKQIDQTAVLKFSSYDDSANFMESLTGWKLKAFMEVPKITVRTHRFSATKTYTDAKVHFWDKHTKGGTPRTQLAIRAQRAEKHWWLTTPVQPSLLRHHRRPSGNPLVLRHLTLQRDKRLDTKDMTATSCYDEDPPPTPLLTNCTLTCLFSDNTDSEFFMNQWCPNLLRDVKDAGMRRWQTSLS